MLLSHFSFILIVLTFTLQTTHSATCTYSHSDKGDVCEFVDELIGEESDIEDVTGEQPGGFHDNSIEYLTAVGSTIKFFPSTVLNKFANLKIVELKNVGMTSLGRAITSCNQLKSLFLEENRLSSIEGGIFASCESLTAISLNRNKITEVDEKAFEGLQSLQRLDLSDNSIKILPSNVFANLQKLTLLILGSNEIETIESELLEPLENLSNFWISENKISEVNDGVFKNNRKLTSIGLRKNQIVKIGSEVFADLKELEELKLDNNLLTELPNLESLISLQVLHIQINKIEKISFNEDLQKLVELDLGRNHIRNISAGTFSYLTKLKKLSLYSNHITRLSAGAFQHLSNMVEIDLSKNQLSHLNGNAFITCSSLEKINVRGNQITKVDEHFFDFFHELKHLIMEDNYCVSRSFNVDEHTKKDAALYDCFNSAKMLGASWILFVALTILSASIKINA